MYIPSNFSSKTTFAEAMARSERRIKDSTLEFGALDAIVFTTQRERELQLQTTECESPALWGCYISLDTRFVLTAVVKN